MRPRCRAELCRGAEPSRITDNPPPGFGGQADPFTSSPKSDSIGSGVTDEGEIAAVLGRMLDHAGRMDAQAVGQVCAASSYQLPSCNLVTERQCIISALCLWPCRSHGCSGCWSGMCSFCTPMLSMHHYHSAPESNISALYLWL